MNFEAFYNQCQSLPDENDRKRAEAFCNKIYDVFNEDNPQFSDMSHICNLFYGKNLTISKTQYYCRKNLVCMFYDWLKEQGAVDDELVEKVHSLRLKDIALDYELYHYYFKDLDEVLGFVKRVGAMNGMGDYDDLLNLKSLVILIWYGIEFNQVCEIKKSDLNRATQTITYCGQTKQFKKEHFDILCRFADLDAHKGFPSQKLQLYKKSPYLMRSAIQSQIKPNNMRKALVRFNAVAVSYGKELSTLCLRRNGIFYSVYQAGDKKSAGVRIQKLLGCDTAFSFGYKEFYEKWELLLVKGG